MLLTLETTVYLKGPGDLNYNRLFDSQTVSFGPLMGDKWDIIINKF